MDVDRTGILKSDLSLTGVWVVIVMKVDRDEIRHSSAGKKASSEGRGRGAVKGESELLFLRMPFRTLIHT
jgi:hypothetical protein